MGFTAGFTAHGRRGQNIIALFEIFLAVDLASRIAPSQEFKPTGIASRVPHFRHRAHAPAPFVLHVPSGTRHHNSDDQDWLEHDSFPAWYNRQ